MRYLHVPIDLLRAIDEQPPKVRIYWLKWLTDYTDEMFRPDFCEFFKQDMQSKGVVLTTESIKTAYDLGIGYFKDGFLFSKKDKRTQKREYSPETEQVIHKVLLYLNEQTGASYAPTKANSECIAARVNEGYSISDFMTVIRKKSGQWLNTEQAKYLRPITLFAPKKFENYLNEPESERKTPSGNIRKTSSAADKAKQFFD